MFYPAASRYTEWELQTLHMTYCSSSFNTDIASEYIWEKMGMHRQNFIEINFHSGKAVRTGRRIQTNQNLLFDYFLLATLLKSYLYFSTWKPKEIVKENCDRVWSKTNLRRRTKEGSSIIETDHYYYFFQIPFYDHFICGQTVSTINYQEFWKNPQWYYRYQMMLLENYDAKGTYNLKQFMGADKIKDNKKGK